MTDKIKLAKPILINEYNSLNVRYTEKDILAERKSIADELEKIRLAIGGLTCMIMQFYDDGEIKNECVTQLCDYIDQNQEKLSTLKRKLRNAK